VGNVDTTGLLHDILGSLMKETLKIMMLTHGIWGILCMGQMMSSLVNFIVMPQSITEKIVKMLGIEGY